MDAGLGLKRRAGRVGRRWDGRFVSGRGGPAALMVGAVFSVCAAAAADPMMPTIPAGTFTVAAATGNATTDTANLKAAITSAKNAGGGTVAVPAGTYLSNQLTLSSNIDLQLAGGATIQNNAPSSTLVTASSGSHDVAITGSGMLDGHAIATSGNNLVSLQGVSRLLVSGVTIANSSHEHLVIENDNNVTVDGITINDDFSKARTGGYLQNTDAIDFSGSHFLIKNSTINAGDDDIVAKPGNVATSDITISKDTIGAGHGISVGGQTNAGLNGMTVSDITFNGTDNGLRLKAGKGQGGVVTNVSFSNITMSNVPHPIIINSWYQSGDQYGSAQVSGSSLHNVTNPGETVVTVDQGNNGAAQYPFFDSISYSNITATGATENAAIIYGLDSVSSNSAYPPRNIDSISFSNVSLSGKYGADIYYVSNLDLSGLKVTATAGNAMNLFDNTPLGDANGDGKVDLNDLNVVLNNLGQITSARSAGNFDGATIIDLNDLNDVLNNLGTNLGTSGLAVMAEAMVQGSAAGTPEPTSGLVLGAGVFLLWGMRGKALGRVRLGC